MTTGFSGCRKPEEMVVASAHPVEGKIHGIPTYYATAMPRRQSAVPILVKTVENHPIKIEPNPLILNGGVDRFAQASLFELYDPLRSGGYRIKTHNERKQTGKGEICESLNKIVSETEKNRGRGLCILTNSSSSPTRERLITSILNKFPHASWFEYEPINLNFGNAVLSELHGEDVVCEWRFDKANVILSLDCDFLESEEDSYIHANRFAAGRNPDNTEMNRLYCVEGTLTLTGANADHRLCVPPSMLEAISAGIAYEVLKEKNIFGDDFLKILRKKAELAKKWEGWIKSCVKDLLKASEENEKKPLVVAGHGQPKSVHAMALAINLALGNKEVSFSIKSQRRIIKPEKIEQLANKLANNEVNTLVIIDCNPVYNAPSNLNWSELQKKATTVIHLSSYDDETALESSIHIPELHYLESWGDARMNDGTLLSIQPVIKPVFGGMSDLEFLTRLSGEKYRGDYETVRETFSALISKSEDTWKDFLKKGFAENTGWQPISKQPDSKKIFEIISEKSESNSSDGIEIVFARSSSIDDGRHYTNIWLQEFPDPITRIVWDNAALISPETAKELGICENIPVFEKESRTECVCKEIEIEVNGKTLKCPAYIQPGIAKNTVVLPLGYGRRLNTIWGITDFTIGFNAYKLRTGNSAFVTGAKIKVLNEHYKIARVQKYDSFPTSDILKEYKYWNYKEEIGKESKFKEYKMLARGRGDSAKQKFSGENQWGMVIDLSKCIGCGACVVACRAENNIPVVGKEQVMRGREMDWIRIDRYYNERMEACWVRFQPVMCMHCENAPCEYVCPFNATVHDSEGLNLMVYNRCAGARYCMNNCPYKVRRFNYLDYQKIMAEELYDDLILGKSGPNPVAEQAEKYRKNEFINSLVKHLRNPDVTVRMRGIAEKCTYCIQRIQEAKAKKKIEAGDSKPTPISDGEIKTACEQACPTGAIIFGNLNDPNSRVSKALKNERGYAVLEHLNTKPRGVYLAKITNPNIEMLNRENPAKTD